MNSRYLILLQLVMGIVGLTSACAGSRFYSPSPYTRFADSPLSALPFSHFYLEDFEDGALNVPGASGGNNWVAGGPGPETDSVEGKSLYSNHGQTALTITFDPAALGGRYPTHAGIVWTDVGYVYAGSYGYGTVVFAAWNALGQSIGSISASVGDGANGGQRAEDRFFGLVHSEGISRISISMTNSIDWELDHLQYGVGAPVEISPNTPWITDTRPDDVSGHDRKQYFKGQTIRFPFKVRNDGTTNVNAKVYLIPAQKTGNSTHGGPWVVAPKTVTLNASSESPVSFDVPVPANAEFGFYDVKAIVEFASDPTIVLDTTEEGANNTNRDSDAAWIGDSLVFGADGFCAGRDDGGTTSPLIWEAPLDQSFMVCRNEPVVLVPGMGGDPSGYFLLPYYLTQRQKYAVIVYSYTNTTNATSARQISADLFDSNLTQWSGAPPNAVEARRRIADARSFLGLPGNAPVKIIAHSFGGVISRTYMDGFAQHTIGDPATNVPYANDIDALVTMASPLWGSYDGAFISDYFIAPNSGRQKDECAIGSDLLWGMNPDGGNICQNHFAFGVVGDEVVDVVSAAATNLAGHSFVITKPGGGAIDHLKIVNVDSPSHVGYLCMSAALDHGSPVGDYVTPYSDWNGNKGAYVFYRVTNALGQNVPCGVRFFLSDLGRRYPNYLGRILPPSTSSMTVIPEGTNIMRYAYATVPLSLQAGTLTKRVVMLGPWGDGDGDGLSDDYELANWGARNSPQNGFTDYDKDGCSDYLEQSTGTNPKDPFSHFTQISFAYNPPAIAVGPNQPGTGPQAGPPPPGVFRMTIDAVPGVTYDLDRSATLQAGGWSSVSTLVMSEDEAGERTLEDTAAPPGQSFYRVRVTVPPPVP